VEIHQIPLSNTKYERKMADDMQCNPLNASNRMHDRAFLVIDL
jgi:hypothetical protein